MQSREPAYAAERSYGWLKGLVSLLLIAAYAVLGKLLEQPMTQTMALKQLEDKPLAATQYQLYQQLWSWGWVVLLVVIVAMFRKELAGFLKDTDEA